MCFFFLCLVQFTKYYHFDTKHIKNLVFSLGTFQLYYIMRERHVGGKHFTA